MTPASEPSESLGNAEIKELDALLADENVGGLKIAVHDPLGMSSVQGIEDLACI